MKPPARMATSSSRAERKGEGESLRAHTCLSHRGCTHLTSTNTDISVQLFHQLGEKMSPTENKVKSRSSLERCFLYIDTKCFHVFVCLSGLFVFAHLFIVHDNRVIVVSGHGLEPPAHPSPASESLPHSVPLPSQVCHPHAFRLLQNPQPKSRCTSNNQTHQQTKRKDTHK